MLKNQFFIHLGNGLFLSRILSDAEIIVSDTVPVVLEVAAIAGAVSVGSFAAAAMHINALVKAGAILGAEIHSVIVASSEVYSPSLQEINGMPPGVVSPSLPG